MNDVTETLTFREDRKRRNGARQSTWRARDRCQEMMCDQKPMEQFELSGWCVCGQMSRSCPLQLKILQTYHPYICILYIAAKRTRVGTQIA